MCSFLEDTGKLQNGRRSHTHAGTQRNTNCRTAVSGYAPCGSVLVITLLQKYRFPLIPKAATPPPAQTRSPDTAAADDHAGRPRGRRIRRYIHFFLPSTFPLHPPLPLCHILLSLLSASTLSLSTRDDNPKKKFSSSIYRDMPFPSNSPRVAGWVGRAPPAGWGWPAGVEVGVSAS